MLLKELTAHHEEDQGIMPNSTSSHEAPWQVKLLSEESSAPC